MYELYVKLRNKRGVTDYQVADAIKIGRSTFSDWKSGRSTPKIEKLLLIANYFDVPITYFTDEIQKQLKKTK